MDKLRLDRTQKIAFARLISDLIEADFIVLEGEMKYFEHIISNEGFSISKQMLIEAKKMDYAKAVEVLCELKKDERKQIVKALKKLSMSDGTCVPLEAIQIFALEQVMEYGATPYSVPAADVAIDNMKVIYIENEDGTAVAKAIEENFRSISNELALAGFDFVLIPHVVNDYRRMDSDYLEKVVQYMIPSISSDKVKSICSDLRNMTTSRFCRDLLDKKLNMRITGTEPSLLIKINESDIVDQFATDEAERTCYANFLKIELKDDVLSQIRELVDAYHSMINCSIMVDSKPNTQKFLYYGFHRSLFDLIAYGREQKEYKLVFDLTDLQKHKVQVYFISEDGDRIYLKLNPQETALFYMIVRKSIDGDGLDWKEKVDYALIDEYNAVYGKIGKSKSLSYRKPSSPMVRLVTNHYKDRTQTNHIRNQINALNCIANKAAFVPEHDKKKKTYKIKAKLSHVTILVNR
ncbi:MAG: hypothetical protein NC113_08825 [Bacteroides sp.]|nr:hypothetical protein [Bacteroides sp.]MCM1448298.1 hypothetical protein [Bacteroides sp.]